MELNSLEIGNVHVVHLLGEPLIAFQLYAQGLKPERCCDHGWIQRRWAWLYLPRECSRKEATSQPHRGEARINSIEEGHRCIGGVE